MPVSNFLQLKSRNRGKGNNNVHLQTHEEVKFVEQKALVDRRQLRFLQHRLLPCFNPALPPAPLIQRMDGQLWGGGAAAAKVLGVATRQRTARAKPGLLKQVSKRAEAGSKRWF